MKSLYSSPTRVYLLIGLIALFGVYSGTKLPISLFPNSARPVVTVGANYGPMTADEYRNTYGQEIESKLRKISTESVHVEKVDSTYYDTNLDIDVTFRWGDDSVIARKEVDVVIGQTIAAIGNSKDYYIGSHVRNRNSGFLAVSFFSKERSPDELFRVIDPILTPKIKTVVDADNPTMWNPQAQDIQILLKPEILIGLNLSVQTVTAAIRQSFETRQAGSIMASGKSIRIMMPRQIQSIEDIGQIAVTTPAGRILPLKDLANISVGASSNSSNIYKTNGASSVILFSSPKPGGNVKAMAEDILHHVDASMKLMPKDIEYRVLVDPSEFIRSAIKNVFHEVAIGSILAVFVLLIFIGSPRNVATAAIEIPISLVLAFILMRIVGMNINLISLGGLALSAGMNVDASVVVMENIFRHFEKVSGKLSKAAKLEIVVTAVKEVRGPVVASTIASLVVFIPLAFTSDLSYAILGDLAKAVVFSHGFSALVALVLVPTVRLHLMSREDVIQHPHSPIESGLQILELKYGQILEWFVSSKRNIFGAFIAIVAALGLLVNFVLPKLPKEVLGKPDTDWIFLSINSEGQTKTRQMEMVVDQVERDLLAKFPQYVAYTFYQIWNPNGGALLVRLKDKKDMTDVLKKFDETFKNTTTEKFWSGPWNPSELPLPNPPQMQIAITGGIPQTREEASREIRELLEHKQVFPNIEADPNSSKEFVLEIRPKKDQLQMAKALGVHVSLDDVFEQFRTLSEDKYIDSFPMNTKSYGVSIGVKSESLKSSEDVGAWSVPVGGKLVPLKALADIKVVPRPPIIRRVKEMPTNFVYGRIGNLDPTESKPRLENAKAMVDEWRKDFDGRHPIQDQRPTISFEDGEIEINEAINQLMFAIGWSILLIFFTMLIQFGSIVEPLIVLAAVPLGLLGVLASLYIFKSSLSLNSALGVILLNGIAVANSIILVDFSKKIFESGAKPHDAVIQSARARLRPILITSLTTVLGMIPIASGFGEGGKVLQPLGIAVAGGLWVSMLLTLFVVPSLHLTYLRLLTKRRVKEL